MTSIHRASLVAVAVLVAGLAGCASAEPARPAGEKLTPAAANLAVRANPYPADQRLLLRAEEESIRRCMAAQDLPYRVRAVDVEDDEWRPNLDARRKLGYGLSAPQAAVEDAPTGLPADRQAAYDLALFGDQKRQATLRLSSGPRFTFSTTGCLARSRTEIYGDVVDAGRVFYVPQQARIAMYHTIAEDPATHEATGRWATCMTERGYRYASPADARSGVRTMQKESTEPNRRRGIDIAIADGECAWAVGLPAAVERVRRTYVAQLPVEQRTELNTAAALRTEALRRASAILH